MPGESDQVAAPIGSRTDDHGLLLQGLVRFLQNSQVEARTIIAHNDDTLVTVLKDFFQRIGQAFTKRRTCLPAGLIDGKPRLTRRR